MTTETRAYELFRPLTILAVVGSVMLFVGGLIMAFSMDREAKHREEQLLTNGLSREIGEAAMKLAMQTVWDEALARLQNGDTAWAEDNIGRYLYEVGHVRYSFVLDRNDRPIFASGLGQPSAPGAYAAFAPALGNVLATVRAEENHRRRTAPDGPTVTDPMQARTAVRIDRGAFRGVYIVIATVVQPDFNRVQARYARAPIVVAALPIDGAFLRRLGERYLEPELRLSTVPMKDGRLTAQIAVRNDRHGYIATLFWTPGNPGTQLAMRLAIPAVALFALFFAVLILLYERGWRAAQKLIASEARASHLAYHDALTGLPNRVMFFDRLGMALDQVRRHGSSIAIHCLDLDRFKEINDTYGHQMGDELIVEAARRIAAVCRRSDLFARLSGDEFAIVQMEANSFAASRLADRIVAAMRVPMELPSGVVHVSCSVGVNVVSDGALQTAEALRHADLALYRAKQGGRGQYCFFEPEMDAAMRLRREMERDLRAALRDGELYMAYQPQADRHGRMIGVEALLRWHHPVRGEVPPAQFVPVAEECGLIDAVGLFSLREAFRAGRRWPDVRVAINISASQLRLKDFHDRIAALLTECGADARAFELEITEGLLLGDDPVTHDSLCRLRAMGFTIALDDFGTGYSSLSYLQRYPIDRIKIDRSFVVNIGVEEEARMVVKAIVRLARALHLEVIAEGVETVEQRDYLFSVGCEEIQGFLFSRPITPSRITELHQQQNASAGEGRG